MIKQAPQSFSFYDFGRLLLQNRKQAGIYGLILIVISFNLCLFLPANMHSPATERLVNIVQLFCFSVMGIINVWFFYKRNFLSALSFSGAKLAYILLLFVAMGLVLFVYYYISGNNGLIMAFASSSAFLLPFLLYQGWMEYLSIPAETHPIWYLPATAQSDGGKLLSAQTTTQVQLKICRKVNEEYHSFPVTSSAKVKLGKVFERFIADQAIEGVKSAIEITDRRQQAFGWQFYEQKWFGFYSKWLNPSRSLAENNVKPNAKILVVRIDEHTVL